MITSNELQYNKIPLTIDFNGIKRTGILFFNMCEEIQLTNVCGKSPVIGNFIFVDNISYVGRAKCLLFKNIDNLTWNFTALSLGESYQNARGGIKIDNTEVVIKETELLDRDTLDGLDLGSIVISDDFQKEEVFEDETSKMEHMRNAIDQKLSNLNKKESNSMKIELDHVRKPTFIDKGKSLDTGVEQNGIVRTNTRFLTKQNNLAIPVNSNVNLEEAFSTEEIQDVLKHHLKKKSTDKIAVEMLFMCKPEGESKITANYSDASSKLEVKIFSVDGCVTELSMLQLMSIVPIVSALVFSVFGIAFLYFGFLLKKKFRIVFIVLCEIFLYFTLYFLFVESLATQTEKIIVSLVLLVIIASLSVLICFFNFVFYLKLSFMAATNFGLITKLSLQEYSTFFYSPYSEWCLIVLFFFGFTLLYLFSKDYFVISMTSIMGTTLTLISLKYYGITDYDFLFNTQVEKFASLKEIDPENVKFAGLYYISAFIGIIIQWVIRRKYNSSKDEIDIMNESGRKVAVNFDNI
jgi:hypothetical protein